MSLVTKAQFKKRVAAEQFANRQQLTLQPPTFEDEGFITTAFLPASSGKVELRCGPPEYHVELFVHDQTGSYRFSLNELIALANVRQWMQVNRANLEGESRIEAEVSYAFRLLAEAIARVPEMNWLLRDSPPHTTDSLP